MPESLVIAWLFIRFVADLATLTVFVLLVLGVLDIRRTSHWQDHHRIRWCGRCHDHPAHHWLPYPKEGFLCLGGWKGRKVKV